MIMSILLYAQTTAIPDPNFEQALIELGYDTGTPDGVVPTSNINTVDMLEIANKNISSLTGIEDFSALNYLDCSENLLTSLNLTQNGGLANLLCQDNSLSDLNTTQNASLLVLYCQNNNISSLDLSINTHLVELDCSNNQLTSLDVSDNNDLNLLYCGSNQITSLDLRQNVVLQYFWCNSNNLSSLNIKNGNNTNIWDFVALNNPNLTCIEVDDASYSSGMWFNIDTWASFSENCPALSIDEFGVSSFSMYPNPVHELMIIDLTENATYSVLDLGGQIVKKGTFKNGENELDLSNLTSGFYFIKVEANERSITKKFIKA
jgi:Leucine-rich repeat (LRR) protein